MSSVNELVNALKQDCENCIYCAHWDPVSRCKLCKHRYAATELLTEQAVQLAHVKAQIDKSTERLEAVLKSLGMSA